jgi:hypothetical protein
MNWVLSILEINGPQGTTLKQASEPLGEVTNLVQAIEAMG